MKATRAAGRPRQSVSFVMKIPFSMCRSTRGCRPIEPQSRALQSRQLLREGAWGDPAQQDECKRGGQCERKGRLAEQLENIETDGNHQRDQEDQDYRAEQDG